MRTLVKMSIVMALLTGLIVLIPLPTKVAAMSEGCDILMSNSPFGPVLVSYEWLLPFTAGEYLTITHTGTAAEATVFFNGVTVATLPPGGSFTYRFLATGDYSGGIINLTGAGNLTGTFTCGFTPLPAEDGEEPFIPGDDRINHGTADRAAPVAFYCREAGIEVIRIDAVTAQGIEDVRVSTAEIEAVGIPEEGSQTLAERDWVIVSRLADGRFQVNAWYADGKPYTVIWQDCDSSTLDYVER